MKYRILSLDGGGTWALIQVKALIELYDASTYGRAVLQDFNLVAANSGGSIVLGGLPEDLKLGELLAFFEDETARRSIFSRTPRFWDPLLHAATGVGPKYSAKNKLPALIRAFPNTGRVPLDGVVRGLRRPGSEHDVHLLILSFDYDRDRAQFFRSSGSSGLGWGTSNLSSVSLGEAIHASSNAPVNYFDAPAELSTDHRRYWDGAIAGCNNPVLAAVTEAITRGQTPTNIVALSIGTASVALPRRQPGEAPSPYFPRLTRSWLLADLRKLATSILDDPPDIATFLAHVSTGGRIGPGLPDSRIVRMNPLISPVKNGSGHWIAPGGMTRKQFNYLANLDMDAVCRKQVNAISDYAKLWLEDRAPNQPIRMKSDTLKLELGQARFGAARAAWEAIR